MTGEMWIAFVLIPLITGAGCVAIGAATGRAMARDARMRLRRLGGATNRGETVMRFCVSGECLNKVPWYTWYFCNSCWKRIKAEDRASDLEMHSRKLVAFQARDVVRKQKG